MLLLLPELRPRKSPKWGDTVWIGVWAGLWGMEPSVLGLRQVWLGREVPLEHWVAGFGVRKLGSESPCCARSSRWLYVYAEGQGREMALQFFCSRWDFSVYPASVMHSKMSKSPSHCGPQVLFRWLFSCCMSEGCLSFILSQSSLSTSGLSLREAHWPLELQVLSLLVARSHEIQPLLLSKPIAMGIHFPHALPCVLLSPALLLNHGSPAPRSNHDMFFSQTKCPYFLPSSMWPLLCR